MFEGLGFFLGWLTCTGEACVLCLHPHSDLSNERHSSSTPIMIQPISCQYYKTQFLPSSHPTGTVWNKVFLYFVRRQEARNPSLCFIIVFSFFSFMQVKKVAGMKMYFLKVRRIKVLNSQLNLKTGFCFVIEFKSVLRCLLPTKPNEQDRRNKHPAQHSI